MSSIGRVTPELGVTDLAQSRHFYRDILGFRLVYDRPEEGFEFIAYEGCELMLDQIGLGRTWATGALEPPLGREHMLAEVMRVGVVAQQLGKLLLRELEESLVLPERIVGVEADGGEAAHWASQKRSRYPSGSCTQNCRCVTSRSPTR